ncbi:MAG: hypothetical protein ACI30S_08170, partial [Muribaculaceae bacterium]
QFQSSKTEIENFVSAYSSDYFELEINDEKSLNIYNSSLNLVAKLEFDLNLQNLIVYEISEDLSLAETKRLELSVVTKITFDYDKNSNLLKCTFDFKDYRANVFLINLGGMKVGNIS